MQRTAPPPPCRMQFSMQITKLAVGCVGHIVQDDGALLCLQAAGSLWAGLVSNTGLCVYRAVLAAGGSWQHGLGTKKLHSPAAPAHKSTPGLTGPLTAVQLMVELKVASSTQAGSGMPLVVPLYGGSSRLSSSPPVSGKKASGGGEFCREVRGKDWEAEGEHACGQGIQQDLCPSSKLAGQLGWMLCSMKCIGGLPSTAGALQVRCQGPAALLKQLAWI